MKLFLCANCSHPLYFENSQCLHCSQTVGFNPASMAMEAVSLQATPIQSQPEPLVYCKNHTINGCNWLVDACQEAGLCQACDLNRYVPNLDTTQAQQQWREFEQAKRRLVYSLLQLGLPVESKPSNDAAGISVDFINPEMPLPIDASSTTGHADGQITVVANEADPVQREQNRVDLKEQYRTLLGHLRHEIGHYYWDVLIKNQSTLLTEYRSLFGDERADYGSALERHYANGAPANWQENFVSAYASSHPWEDWAETWSHYMHLVDLAETAASYGVSINPELPQAAGELAVGQVQNPFSGVDFDSLMQQAIAVSVAVNSFNRSLGQNDAYPFVLTDSIHNKLEFIHRVVRV